MKLIDVPIENIHIENRYRRNMGDIDALAANIHEMGLLQPIGIDEDFNLIYGARRLEACENLGWKKIPCVVVKLTSIIAGEWAENEMRKQFTPSERSAIAAAIEASMPERRGGDHKSKAAIAALDPKGKTADIAARAVGFQSAESFLRAKTVVDKGIPEVVAAMDAGKVSIDAAAKIASQPKADQKTIIDMPKDQQREVVRQIRRRKRISGPKSQLASPRDARGVMSADIFDQWEFCLGGQFGGCDRDAKKRKELCLKWVDVFLPVLDELLDYDKVFVHKPVGIVRLKVEPVAELLRKGLTAEQRAALRAAEW